MRSQPRNHSPTTMKASRFRGEYTTHTLALQLQCQAQKLRIMEASPSLISYASQRKKVSNVTKDAKAHFRSQDVDKAYEAELGDQLEGAEDICTQKYHEMELAMKIIKDAESAKKDLKSILPMGFGAIFHGDPVSWPSFRKIFESCLDLDPMGSAATMKNLIGDSKQNKQ